MNPKITKNIVASTLMTAIAILLGLTFESIGAIHMPWVLAMLMRFGRDWPPTLYLSTFIVGYSTINFMIYKWNLNKKKGRLAIYISIFLEAMFLFLVMPN